MPGRKLKRGHASGPPRQGALWWHIDTATGESVPPDWFLALPRPVQLFVFVVIVVPASFIVAGIRKLLGMS